VQTGQRVGSVFRHENRLVVFDVPFGRFVLQPHFDDFRMTGQRIPSVVPIEPDDVQMLAL